MAFNEIKEKAWEANQKLVDYNLITLTWGNASEYDPALGAVAIKPSGVDYKALRPSDMVVLDLSGRVIQGHFNPSSDTPTHLHLYNRFPEIRGIVHTHSTHATCFAQAGQDIPCFGTTHADTFFGKVPVTRPLKQTEIRKNYEKNTGAVITETFSEMRLSPLEVPGILVASHGPFAFGPSSLQAAENALVLEKIAEMAYLTKSLNQGTPTIPPALLNKHFQRKHGAAAYYGQKTQAQLH